jgi:hypothetical protein
VSTFIHFDVAYLGISPHFLLWRHLFCVKSSGKCSDRVGAVMFCLRLGLKSEWIDTNLPDNTAGWRSEWFYIVDQLPALPRRTGHKPVKIPEWDLRLSSREVNDIKEVPSAGRGPEEEVRDRRFSRQVVLPTTDSTNQGPGPPCV